jgi:hypothetical protein
MRTEIVTVKGLEIFLYMETEGPSRTLCTYQPNPIVYKFSYYLATWSIGLLEKRIFTGAATSFLQL